MGRLKKIVILSLALLMVFSSLPINTSEVYARSEEGTGSSGAGGGDPAYFKRFYKVKTPDNPREASTDAQIRYNQKEYQRMKKKLQATAGNDRVLQICDRSDWVVYQSIADPKGPSSTYSRDAIKGYDYAVTGEFASDMRIGANLLTGLYGPNSNAKRAFPSWVPVDVRNTYNNIRRWHPRNTDSNLTTNFFKVGYPVNVFGDLYTEKAFKRILKDYTKSNSGMTIAIYCSAEGQRVINEKATDNKCPATSPSGQTIRSNWTLKSKKDDTKSNYRSGHWNEPTHYVLRMTPIYPSNLSALSLTQQAGWYKTHKSQTVTVETEYGKLLKSLDRDGVLKRLQDIKTSDSEYQRVVKLINEAIAKDAKKDYSDIDINLTEENQKGFARGGAFTVRRSAKYAKVDIDLDILETETTKTYERTITNCNEFTVEREAPEGVTMTRNGKDICKNSEGRCKYDEVDHTMSRKTETKTEISNSEEVNNSNTKFYISQTGGYDFFVDAYQIINVVCNAEDAQPLIDLMQGEVVKNGYSVYARSKKFTSEHMLPLSSRNITAALFYGGNCDFKFGCTPEPSKSLSASNARSNKTDNNATEIDGRKLFGAQTEDANTSFIQFFRDGEKKSIRTDVWSLSNEDNNGVTMPSKALSTNFSFPNDVTPEYKEGNTGLLKLYDGNGNPLNLSARDNSFFINQPGELNKIQISSMWASEGSNKDKEAKPFTATFVNHYKPLLKSTVPTSINGDPSKISTVSKEEPINATCLSGFNSKDSRLPILSIMPKYEDPKIMTYEEVSSNPDTVLTINFVKSSAK